MTQIDRTLKVITEAAGIEAFGYDFYNAMRKQVSDPTGQVVLAFLAGLEVDHMVWLEKEYTKQLRTLGNLHEGHIDSIQMAGKEENFIVDSLPEMYRGTDMVKALEFAVEVEERSVKFYRDAMKSAEEEDLRDMFRRLADFELDHVKLLKHNIASLKKKGIWTAPGGD
jgi:rubrerythrin